MNHTPILRCAGRIVAGASCFLLAAFLAGCNEVASPPKTPAEPLAAIAETTDAAAADAEPATTDAELVEPAPDAAVSKSDGETTTIGACDGGAAIEVPKDLKGQALADSLMAQWKRSHPDANWVAEIKEQHALKPPADNSDVLKGGQAKGDAYGNFTERDLLIWSHETEKFVAEGSRIFHSGDELGSTVGASCDMCHPHAANTHPETYPKYQVQLGRVALLRDMINWCMENPVRAEKLDPDGPKMRALEAYIQSQRKGVAMDYGKH